MYSLYSEVRKDIIHFQGKQCSVFGEGDIRGERQLPQTGHHLVHNIPIRLLHVNSLRLHCILLSWHLSVHTHTLTVYTKLVYIINIMDLIIIITLIWTNVLVKLTVCLASSDWHNLWIKAGVYRSILWCLKTHTNTTLTDSLTTPTHTTKYTLCTPQALSPA